MGNEAKAQFVLIPAAAVLSRARWVFKACVTLCALLTIVKMPVFRSYKHRLLGTWQTPERRGRLDNLLYTPVMVAWQRFEYWNEKNPDIREQKKALIMGGESGANWARAYNALNLGRSGGEDGGKVNHANPLYESLESVLGEPDRDPTCVIQIGSSSGRQIAWVARRHPRVRCIGTDIYPEVIEVSRQAHRARNLEFQVVSAQNIAELLARIQSARVVVFSSGSLQYVQPEHIECFFEALSLNPGIQVVASETASIKDGPPTALAESKRRGRFSYTHNYKASAERHNFVTLECRIIDSPRSSGEPPTDTVTYFYRGIAPAAVRAESPPQVSELLRI